MREPNSWSLPRRTLPNTEEEASSGAAAALAPIPTKSGTSRGVVAGWGCCADHVGAPLGCLQRCLPLARLGRLLGL